MKYKNILITTLLIILCSCENDMQTVMNLNKKIIGVEEATNIESFLSQSGRVTAQLNSPLMYRHLFDTPRIEFPKTLRVLFYDSTLKVENILFARYGTYKENDKLVQLRDSVILVKPQGDTMTTQELWWDQNRELLYTDKLVIIRQIDGTHLFALNGMQCSQNMKLVSLFNVSGTMPIPDSTLPGN